MTDTSIIFLSSILTLVFSFFFSARFFFSFDLAVVSFLFRLMLVFYIFAICSSFSCSCSDIIWIEPFAWFSLFLRSFSWAGEILGFSISALNTVRTLISSS